MVDRIGTVRRLTPPATEPVTLAEAKKHLRINTDFTKDDNYIQGLISSARDHAEKYCGRSWATADFVWTVEALTLSVYGSSQYKFKIPMQFISSINEIGYLDSDSVDQVIATSLIGLDSDRQWVTIPDTIEGSDWVIRFSAGPDLGTSQNEVTPDAIKQAILLLVGDAYENRQASILVVSITENPAVVSLLHDYRVNMGV